MSSTLVLLIMLMVVFFLFDPCITVMLVLMGIMAYGYLKSK